MVLTLACPCCAVMHFCTCRFLEDELARRYRDAAPGTLALLQVCADGTVHACTCALSQHCWRTGVARWTRSQPVRCQQVFDVC